MPEFDQARETGRSSRGRAIVLLPSGSPKGVTIDIEEVKEALKNAMTNKTLPKVLEFVSEDQTPAQKSKKTSGKILGKSVPDKLNLVLKRLDEIETQVRRLENKSPKSSNLKPTKTPFHATTDR